MEWITTQDLIAEAWRRLLEYANIDIALEAIIARHGQPTSKGLMQNYKKQSTQIRVAILQAQEYFEAARVSSLFTSPNHIYYGMVSLTAAIMLLRGSGEQALDRLRQDPRNCHHGLDFTTAVTQASCHTGLSILENSKVRVLDRGHFINWYSTLPTREDAFAIVQYRDGNTSNTRREPVGAEDTLIPEKLVKQKYAVLDLVTRLPDMCNDLNRYGILVPASRINFECKVEMKKKKHLFIWRIHGAPSHSHLERILNAFKSPACYMSCWACTDYQGQTGCVVSFNLTTPDSTFEYPSMREDLNNEQFAYAITLDTHEIGDAYMIGYALSMLARYYPDYWIGCLDSHCKAAKVIDRLMFILSMKFPVMALKFLSYDDIVISTHKPPWYE